MTAEYTRSTSVTTAVNAAIEGATVTKDALEDERVAFQRDQLAEVVRFYKADKTQALTTQAIRANTRAAFDAIIADGDTHDANHPGWNLAWAGMKLNERLTKITPATYTQGFDGTLALRARRMLDEENT